MIWWILNEGQEEEEEEEYIIYCIVHIHGRYASSALNKMQ
jgi:hypothetical protein